MKKKSILTVAAAILLASCGTADSSDTTSNSDNNGNILGSILGAVSNGETIGNVLTSVIGLDKLKTKNLYGTWKYESPGCAFTSDNALAKAGGEVAAAEIEKKLKMQYDRLGLASSNTYIVFAEDGTFTSKIGGKSFNGKWTFDESTSQLNMKGVLLSINGYAKRNGTGISVLFEATKLLTLMQTMASLSGNSTFQSVGEISKNYDGLRIGFDMK